MDSKYNIFLCRTLSWFLYSVISNLWLCPDFLCTKKMCNLMTVFPNLTLRIYYIDRGGEGSQPYMNHPQFYVQRTLVALICTIELFCVAKANDIIGNNINLLSFEPHGVNIGKMVHFIKTHHLTKILWLVKFPLQWILPERDFFNIPSTRRGGGGVVVGVGLLTNVN